MLKKKEFVTKTIKKLKQKQKTKKQKKEKGRKNNNNNNNNNKNLILVREYSSIRVTVYVRHTDTRGAPYYRLTSCFG